MIAILLSIRKTTPSRTAPVYTVAFEIDGTRRVFHATVRVREVNAIHFREKAMDNLLANNMDEGRKVYDAILHTHQRRKPRLPVPLGDLVPAPASRSEVHELEPV